MVWGDRNSGACWRSSCRLAPTQPPGSRLPTLHLPNRFGVQFKLVRFYYAQRRAGRPRSSPFPLRGIFSSAAPRRGNFFNMCCVSCFLGSLDFFRFYFGCWLFYVELNVLFRALYGIFLRLVIWLVRIYHKFSPPHSSITLPHSSITLPHSSVTLPHSSITLPSNCVTLPFILTTLPSILITLTLTFPNPYYAQTTTQTSHSQLTRNEYHHDRRSCLRNN
ncbi:MAG: hypothetical protein LBQ66_12455 [Planctomycetaceae bacterium]|nr:hypothetical protein [Planctomycetaceae bacterium]